MELDVPRFFGYTGVTQGKIGDIAIHALKFLRTSIERFEYQLTQKSLPTAQREKLDRFQRSNKIAPLG